MSDRKRKLEAERDERGGKRQKTEEEGESMMTMDDHEEEETPAQRRVHFAEKDTEHSLREAGVQVDSHDMAALHFLPSALGSFESAYDRDKRLAEDDDSITPFNMDEELQHGHFDKKSGSYIDKKAKEIRRKALEDDDGSDQEEDEPWLQEFLDNKDKKQAPDVDKVLDVFNRHTYSNKPQKKSEIEALDLLTIQRRIVEVLKEGESVTGALRRMGDAKREKRKMNRKKGIKPKDDEPDDPFDTLTELADNCVDRGYSSVYQKKREQILTDIGEMLRKQEEGNHSDEESIQWEYRTSADDTNIYGPFATSQMIAWSDSGYFTANPGVQCRMVGRKGFLPVADIPFKDYEGL